MENIRKGDKLAIYCYKHDGTLEHTSDSAIVIENNEEVLICGNGKTRITEKDGRSHMTNEPAILFFYVCPKVGLSLLQGYGSSCRTHLHNYHTCPIGA